MQGSDDKVLFRCVILVAQARGSAALY